MLSINVDLHNIQGLQKQIEFVQSLQSLQNNSELQDYFKQKCLETVKQVSRDRLTGGTTNDEAINQYLNNHKIRSDSTGFVIYNDTTVETSSSGYGGKFSVALAFEYGTGIVGENSPKEGAWEYNVNKHNFAWTYFKDGKKYSTYGYEGFEIYRNAKIEIEANMGDWITKYLKGKM